MIRLLLQIVVANAIAATLLALLVAIATRCWRNSTLAHLLWLLVLIKLVTPPLWYVPLYLPTEVATGAAPDSDTQIFSTSSVLETGKAMPDFGLPPEHNSILDTLRNSVTWAECLAAGWGAGALGWALTFAARIVRFQRLASRTGAAPRDIQAHARELAARLGLKHVPGLRVSAGLMPPLVWAILSRPLVILPSDLLASLSRRQRRLLIAHELAHCARRDHWTRRFEMLVLCIYWWHPVAWWACRRLRQAEEECCDACVVRLFPSQAREYTECLMTTLDFLAGRPLRLPAGASGFSAVTQLKRRFEMILDRRSVRLPWPLKWAVLACGVPALAISAELQRTGQAASDVSPIEVNEVESQAVQLAQNKAVVDQDRANADELLHERVSCNLKDAPLSEFIEQISTGAGSGKIVVDKDSLREQEVTLETRVTLQVQEIRRSSALNLVLKPLGLAHYIENGVIHIVGWQAIDARLETRRYYIGDLNTSRWTKVVAVDSGKHSLRDFLVETVRPPGWAADDFGNWYVHESPDHRYLEVWQTKKVHLQISRLLNQLRAASADPASAAWVIPMVKKRATIQLKSVSLAETVRHIAETYDVNIHLGPTRHSQAEINLDIRDATLRDALSQLCGKPICLDYEVRDEVIRIFDYDSEPVYTQTYAVSDLIVSKKNKGAADFEPLVRRIQTEVLPHSWIKEGGPGGIQTFPNNLSVVIGQTEQGHKKVNAWLVKERHERDKIQE